MRTAVVILLLAAIASGCEAPPSTPVFPGRWAVATATGRAESPEAAATQAADSIRRQLGASPVRAVVFFECFDEPDPRPLAAAMARLFPQAELVGCSADAVLSASAASSDRAVAVLAIGGEGCQFASAFAPGTFGSSAAAGQWLARQLPRPDGNCLRLVLAAPRTVNEPNWDANSLLAGLAGGDRAHAPLIFGGLAGERGPAPGSARVYHAGRAFAGGVAVLQLAGPLDWNTRSGHEQLRVGPTWRPRQIHDRSFGSLAASADERPAERAATACLNAQDRAGGHIGRLLGNLEIPLDFRIEAGQTIRLSVPPREDDRFVFLKPATASGRSAALAGALDTATLPAGVIEGSPFSLLCLPAGPHNAFVEEAESWQRAIADRPRSHPAAIGWLSPGQFAPLRVDDVWTYQYSDHLFSVVQVARRK